MSQVLWDAVQITADNTDVTGGRISDTPPSWATNMWIQLLAPDSDWLFDVSVDNVEFARSAAPHRCQADNLQQFDLNGPAVMVPLTRNAARAPDILINVDVVTAGIGMLGIRYS